MVKVKRIYEKPARDDGFRILVDRLWPRGISKDRAHVDLWLRDAAPSGELRKWFSHDPDRWQEFKRRYYRELKANNDVLSPVIGGRGRKTVTLLFGSREEKYNNAVALKEYISRRNRTH